jgi:hypothetical protein
MQRRLLLALTAAAVVGGTLGAPPSLAEPPSQPVATAAANSNTLRAGQVLRRGDSRLSANRRFRLVMRSSGNLVLSDRKSRRTLWSSQTSGNRGAFARLKLDGNLVVYSKSRRPLYTAGTGGRSDARQTRLRIGNTGVAVVLQGKSKLWSSKQALHQVGNGQLLTPGQWRRSPNGNYGLVMQSDGNLVLYETGSRKALWSSQTSGNPGAFAALQRDGNLVVYSSSRQPLYHSATSAGAGTVLVVQDDGNAVLYSGGKALWGAQTDVHQLGNGQLLRPGQSRRSRNGQYALSMYSDGNLVLVHQESGTPLWSSQTSGNPGAFAVLQRGGNLVVLSSSRHPLYSTSTAGDTDTSLLVQDDGNAVLYSAGKGLWSSQMDVHQLGNGQLLRPGQSRRSRNGQYALSMYSDGNLVLVDQVSGKALWSSQTSGNPGAFAALQRDGNLVVLSSSGQPLYATGTAGGASTVLLVQSDGNAVLYAGSVPLWSSRAGRT